MATVCEKPRCQSKPGASGMRAPRRHTLSNMGSLLPRPQVQMTVLPQWVRGNYSSRVISSPHVSCRASPVEAGALAAGDWHGMLGAMAVPHTARRHSCSSMSSGFQDGFAEFYGVSDAVRDSPRTSERNNRDPFDIFYGVSARHNSTVRAGKTAHEDAFAAGVPTFSVATPVPSFVPAVASDAVERFSLATPSSSFVPPCCATPSPTNEKGRSKKSQIGGA